MLRLTSKRVAAVLALTLGLGMASGAQAQAKQLTLCWAAWDPANALVELSKDFTAKTGIQMKFEFVPWTSYADRFINELNSHGKLCDLIIGDSQWIGGAAVNGHYVKLNDFFTKNKISMDDFMPATVVGYAEWPKNTANYWALPAMADAVGWTYRKDWFARPELRAEFKQKYKRELAPPTTMDELKQTAEFFQGRKIDGKTVYGVYIFTERGSEGITMGVTNALYAWGFQYEDPKKPYHLDGFVNSPNAVKGLEFYKALYKCCTAPGMTNAYMQEGLDAFKSGQVAMQMNWFAFFPGLYKDPNVGGDKIGFFVTPKELQQFTQLGGQGISVVSYSDHKEDALEYIKWFAQADVQKKWWQIGGY
jgi:multiple sugar transport system substrate-binding protein